MRAVMYHYVRPADPALPSFRYLDVGSFRRQLDHLEATCGLVTLDELRAALDGGPCPTGALLTFDDGLRDHVEHVLPELRRRRALGVFYVSSAPHVDGIVLDVHRTHRLLGRLGGTLACAELERRLDDDDLDPVHRDDFDAMPYTSQGGDEDAVRFKRLLNYFVREERRSALLGEMEHALTGGAPTVADVYASPDDLAELSAAGMVVGSHAHTHRVLSRLSPDEQADELRTAFGWLDDVVGPQAVRTFCFPYGGHHTFDATTLALLTELGCEMSFTADPEDVGPDDLAQRPLTLPRWDCNRLPHGAAAPIP